MIQSWNDLLNINVSVRISGSAYGSPTEPGTVASLGYEATFTYAGPLQGLLLAWESWRRDCPPELRTYRSRWGKKVKQYRFIFGVRFPSVLVELFPFLTWPGVLSLEKCLRSGTTDSEILDIFQRRFDPERHGVANIKA